MKAKDAKVGHFYSLEGNIFIVSYPDEIPSGVHVWYYNDKKDYFYDKHIFSDVEIEEAYPKKIYKHATIMHIFSEDDYFVRNF